MTRKQDSARSVNWKEIVAAEGDDFLRPLVQEVVQQVLEAEMDEAVGAGKSERTAQRVGYRSDSKETELYMNFKTANIENVRIFYREAGDASKTYAGPAA